MYVQKGNFGTKGTFGYEIHNEKYDFPMHIHQFVELTLLIDGEMSVTVNGKTETAKSGQFILIFPFQTHSYSSVRENHFVIYTFSPSLIADFIKVAEGKVGASSVFNALESTEQLFNSRLLNEQDLSPYGIRSCLYAMLSDFTRQVELVNATYDSNVLSKLIQFLNEHYNEQISLDTVAHYIGYSANYLSHCIKKSLNMNFCTLLGCIRVETAKHLLHETDRTVLEIALECGFTNERSFHRHFKNLTGCTPAAYRSNISLEIINRQYL